MYITLTPEIDIDNTPEDFAKKCYFCESKINLQLTYHDDKIINSCPLCHIVVNYCKEYIYHSILCHTKLSQLEIIKKTWEFYNSKGYVPKPTEIDPNTKIIKIPTFIFANFRDKKYFQNFCVFFTNKIENMLTDDIDDIFTPSKDKKIMDILDYFDIPEYIFTDEEREKKDGEINNVRNNNYDIMIQTEDNLKKKFIKL